MKRVENECVGCPAEIGCAGGTCPYSKVIHYYCDNCREEKLLYEYDGKELCIDCIKERLDKVSDYDI